MKEKIYNNREENKRDIWKGQAANRRGFGWFY